MYTVQLRVRRVEGAVARILRALSGRGFSVRRAVVLPESEDALSATLVLQGDRSRDALRRQLGRLFDVTQVTLRHTA